jgi:hypothetical protein
MQVNGYNGKLMVAIEVNLCYDSRWLQWSQWLLWKFSGRYESQWLPWKSMVVMESQWLLWKSLVAMILTGCYGSQGLLRNFSCWLEVIACQLKSMVAKELLVVQES